MEDANGNLQSNHQIKESILWEAYKKRQGTLDSHPMAFNLQQFLQISDNLQCLEEPFSHEEIDSAIQNMPNDKASGPDGFNTNFIKRYWSIIK